MRRLTAPRLTRAAAAAAAAVTVTATGVTVASAASSTYEAETMRLASTVGKVIYNDSGASGGRHLLIWSNGTAKLPVSDGFDRLAIRAIGDQCNGAPKMRVAVDGRTLAEFTVSARTWTTYTTPSIAFAPAARSIDVSFVNDARYSSCDRNLRLDTLSLSSRPTPVVTSSPTPTPVVTSSPTPTPVVTSSPTPTPVVTSSPTGNPFVGASLYVDPYSLAAQDANRLRSSDPVRAALLDSIASRPQAAWYGGWNGTGVRSAVDGLVSAAAARNQMPMLVLYGISSGLSDATRYHDFVRQFAEGIAGRPAVVFLEPDAISLESTRATMVADAVEVLTTSSRTAVYIDAGHAKWHSPSVMADRLQRSGVAKARGFVLNVSNFDSTSAEADYGSLISNHLGGKPFVIDTSRNGIPGDPSDWCNQSGMALGASTTSNTGLPQVDAFAWVKRPGESDGTCNGGPVAGVFWVDYAVGLAERVGY